MTRINVGVHPRELSRQHLLAEHREITRIPNAIKSGRFNDKGIPAKFTLGTGHVKFFYFRLRYLHKRYLNLLAECIRRGYNVTNKSDAFHNLPEKHYGDYSPTDEDRNMIIERINQRGGLL